METKGLLPHYSLSDLPLQRQQIINALKNIANSPEELNFTDKKVLSLYETEFEINKRENSVLIYSKTDSNQMISRRFFEDNEKFIYHYKDLKTSISISPLASLDAILKFDDNYDNHSVIYGNLGLRLFGTIDKTLGYYLQATNGAVLSGERELALEDPKLRQNVKFADLDSDFDFSESHVRYQSDWFYGIIGRETRLVGAGLEQHLLLSANAPPMNSISVGAVFSNFEYRYSHAGALGLPRNFHNVGVETDIPDKFVATHRFAFRPSWGELAFWECIIYSDRNIDFAYLNPLSFFKSLEHSLRDRDNSIMGGDFTFRPFGGIQIKGSYLLDDIIFSKIGTGFWSNKSAWNIAIFAALPIKSLSINIGTEYSRVEPYTFTHFNVQNSMTNDRQIIGSYLQPNSDCLSMNIQCWWGNRYPLEIKLSYIRHGENVYDIDGKLIKNVGGDPLQSRRPPNPDENFPGDPETVTFLDGNLDETFTFQIGSGWEFLRGFNLYGYYLFKNSQDINSHQFRVGLRFKDF
jgi:hypothetical protein